MAVIVLQPRATADLTEIWEFIADDSDEKADAFIDLIDQKFQLLARHSGLGGFARNWPRVCAVCR